MPVSNLQITPIPTQRPRTAFTVQGTFDLLPPGGLTLSVQDSGTTTAADPFCVTFDAEFGDGAATTSVTPTVKPGVYSFSFQHPGFPAAGTYTITVGGAGSSDTATVKVTVARLVFPRWLKLSHYRSSPK